MPVFNERNPARIAGGFGGTVSLLLSVTLVVSSLVGVGFLSLLAVKADAGARLTLAMTIWLGAIVVTNSAAAAAAMIAGVRHFERIET